MANNKALPHFQFDDAAQQREAAQLGMWVFLATEVLFFGGLFTGYLVYRSLFPEVFAAASEETDLWMGCLNTAVLLTSSLTMALAVHAVRQNHTRGVKTALLLTGCLGLVFLGIKGYEYHDEWTKQKVPWLDFVFDGPDPSKAAMFFVLYFVMTGLHALHLLVGVGLVAGLWVRADCFSEAYDTPVEVVGLYWHFVDIVWIFLFPLLYLID